MSDVVLVFMPYGTVDRPPLGVAYLKAGLDRIGISCSTVHGHVLFADRIGLGSYNTINNSSNTTLIGDWTFSRAAFPGFECDDEAYFKLLEPRYDRDELRRVRDEAGKFIEELAQQIVAGKPKMVGCSSMFQQNCASLALLRRVKELAPETITLMGGANCETVVGRALHTNFDWVDYVFSGECDELFPDFCRWIVQGVKPDYAKFQTWPPDSVFTPKARVLGKEREAGLALVHNMDALPIPNFDEYFEQLKDTQIAKKISPALLLETSRGCWWGEVSRCTFCGLSAGTIGFRSKSPDRAFDEIDYMSKKHDSTLFELVDNIMDMKYFDTLLPRVADDPRPFRFFYEIKTNLKRDQVEMLDRAGVKWIQPGIEGLNDKLLKIMLKGNNACHGIRLLKWSRQFGIYVMWNYLCDAPGELDEWHKDEIDLIPLLTHLQAPWNAGTSIRFDRFARYTIKADEYQLELEPCDSYQHIYPLQGEALRDQAYFFYNKNKTVINNGEPQPYMDQLKARMEQWRELFYERTDKGLTENPSASAPELRLTRPDANTIVLEDTRPCAVQPRWELTGLQRVVYDACDAGETLRAITATVHACGHEQVTEGDVQGILDEFVAAKTAVFVSSRYLSLGVEAPYKDYEAV